MGLLIANNECELCETKSYCCIIVINNTIKVKSLFYDMNYAKYLLSKIKFNSPSTTVVTKFIVSDSFGQNGLIMSFHIFAALAFSAEDAVLELEIKVLKAFVLS